MVKSKQGNWFLKSAAEHYVKDPATLVARAKRLSESSHTTEVLEAHEAIRHPALREFWGRCLDGREEVPWATWWLHFPTGLGPEVFVEATFSSQKERTAFQSAVRVVGGADHFTVAMADAAFPPGIPLGTTVSKLVQNARMGLSISEVPAPDGKYLQAGMQALGFWDEAPVRLPALKTLAREVSSELAYASGERCAAAQVTGPVGSGMPGVAIAAAQELLGTNFWSSVVYVSLQGVTSAEMGAARVATALGILSFPVMADELLRITAWLHSRPAEQGRLGILLDAEGSSSRAEELFGLATLVTTLVNASENVQVIIACEAALDLPRSAAHTTFSIGTTDKASGADVITRAVRPDVLGGFAKEIATACGHQAFLLDLAISNLQNGVITAQNVVDSASSSISAKPVTTRGKKLPGGQFAASLLQCIFGEVAAAKKDALLRLSILPCTFNAAAAAKVMGNTWSGSQGIEELLSDLCKLGFLRNNLAHCTWGMPPAIRALLQAEARSFAPETYETAIVAFVENCLRLAENASALTAAKAQVEAMWTIDRERAMFDELVALLRSPQPLPVQTTAVCSAIVSTYMDTLSFRLSIRQQQELCFACAHAAREQGDVLGEANCLQHLGQVGQLDAADAAMARTMALMERHLTADHPVVADLLAARARLQTHAGHHYQAERLLRRSLAIQVTALGEDSQVVVATRTLLAGALIALAAPDRAEPLLRAALDANLKDLGPQHPDTALAQCRLASCLHDLQQYQQAEHLYLDALDGWRESLGHTHPQNAILLGQLAIVSRCLQNPEASEQYYRRSIQMWKEMCILDQPELQEDLKGLASILRMQGRGGEAGDINVQLSALSDAVRAAHHRATKRAAAARSLGQKLLSPLRAAFCMPQGRKPALMDLPDGVEDADLEDLKRAARARKVIDIHATSATQDIAPEGIAEIQDQAGVTATSQALQAKDTSSGVQLSVEVPMSQEDGAEAETPTGLESQGTTLVKDNLAEGMTDPSHINRILGINERPPFVSGPFKDRVKSQAVAARPLRRSPTPDSDTDAGKIRKTAFAPKKVPEGHYSQAVPFGSKGRGPSAGALDRTPPGSGVPAVAPTGEASIWAASLRNAELSLGNLSGATKRTSSSGAVSARSDASTGKARLPAATVPDSKRHTSKTGSSGRTANLSATIPSCDSPQSGGDLIRAHTLNSADVGAMTEHDQEGRDWNSDAESYHSARARGQSFTSDSEYTSNDTLDRVGPEGSVKAKKMWSVYNNSAQEIGQVNEANPANEEAGKAVMRFFNPVYSQPGAI